MTMLKQHGAEGGVLARVWAHWAYLRDQAGCVPTRADLDPARLGAALSHVFVAEILTPRVARMRLCGHRVEELLGMDLRGMPVSALFSGAAREAVMEATAQVQRGARVMLALEREAGLFQRGAKGRLALLPLTDGSGQITHLLGVIETEGAPRAGRFRMAERVMDEQHKPARPQLRVIQGGRG